MKKFFNDPGTYFLIYIIACIITFGHAYHQTPDTEVKQFAGQTYTIENGIGTKAIGGMLSCIFWPLYWSVQVQKKS